MFANLLVFLLSLIPCLIHGQTDYCQTNAQHTMCKYKAKACTKPQVVYGLTAADRTALLKAHNDLRLKVATGKQAGQPAASNMKELVWDSELEVIAQRWADQCTFAHDQNRDSARFYVGQNVFVSMSSSGTNKAADGAQVVNAWYNEVTSPGFNSNNIEPFQFTSGTGHYTQVVWADTKYLGCGYTFYYESNTYRKLVVCNYGMGGNWLGLSMYKKGPAASTCTNGLKSTAYPGLCQ